MLGILFCEYRKPIMNFVSRPVVIASLAALILAIASVQAMVMHFPSNLERFPADGWGFVGFDVMLFQKYVGIFLFCGLLTHVAGWMKRPLAFVADYSFGLFFMHGIVIAVLMRLPAAAWRRMSASRWPTSPSTASWSSQSAWRSSWSRNI